MNFKFSPYVYMIVILVFSVLILIPVSIMSNSTYNDLELNLGTELIGIILTITGISEVIKKREKDQWSKVTRHILRKVCTFNNGFITNIRVFLNVSYTPPFHTDPTVENIIIEQIRILELTEKTIIPKLPEEILDITTAKWKKVFNDLINLNSNLIGLIQVFGNKMDSDTYADILSIQTNLEKNLKNYEAFPDLYVLHPPITHKNQSEFFKKNFAENLGYSLNVAVGLNRRLFKENKGYFKKRKFNLLVSKIKEFD